MSMKITIKTLLGKEIFLEVEPSDKIETIKDRIKDIVGFPPYMQRLFLNGAQLNDELTISNYKNIDKSIIHMIPRLKGGGEIDKVKNEIKNFFIEKNNEDKNLKESKKEDDIPFSNNISINNEENNIIDSNNLINQSEVNNISESNININTEKKDDFNKIINKDNDKKEIVDEDFFSEKYLKRIELNVNLF